MNAEKEARSKGQDITGEFAPKPQAGRIWFVVLVGAVALMVLFPPLRRAGIWTNSQNRPISSGEAYRFDRFEFGYSPSFRTIGDIGKQEETEGLSTVTLLETGAYQYKAYRWLVDWQWVVALGIIVAIGVGLIAVVELAILKAAAEAAPLSSQERLKRRLLWLFAVVIVALGLAFIRSHIELRSDRERIAARCREWSVRLKKDASDREALGNLVKVLNGNWSFARTYAAWAIGDAGPNALPAIDDLIRVINADDLFVSQEALKSIGKVSKGSEKGVDVLIHKLDEGWVTASFAANGLGEIGAPAERAIGPLERIAQSSDNSTVVHSAKAAIEDIQKAIATKAKSPVH